MAVFWVVALCTLVEVYQRFRGPCCLHHQGNGTWRWRIDVPYTANLLAFVQYESNSKINDDFLFCQSLPTYSTSKVIFNSLNDFIIRNKMDVSTDGVNVMSGKYKWLTAHMWAVIPNVKQTHYCIHRKSMAVRRMPQKLKIYARWGSESGYFIKAQLSN
jgi:hypothetical protein